MMAILVAMAFIPDQRKPLWLGVASLGILIVAYVVFKRGRKEVEVEDEHHSTRHLQTSER
jgi:GABA permease